MTPEELAEQTGLSLEEAEMVLLARRSRNLEPLPGTKTASRLAVALGILRAAEQERGVASIVFSGETMLKVYLPLFQRDPGGFPKKGEGPVGRVVDSSEDYKQ